MSVRNSTTSTPTRPENVQDAEQDYVQVDTGSHAKRQLFTFACLVILGVIAILASLSWSSVGIPVDQVVTILIGGEAQKGTWETIVMDIRLPRVLTAMLVGTLPWVWRAFRCKLYSETLLPVHSPWECLREPALGWRLSFW